MFVYAWKLIISRFCRELVLLRILRVKGNSNMLIVWARLENIIITKTYDQVPASTEIINIVSFTMRRFLINAILTRIKLLRILLTLVTRVKPVPNALDGISKDTLFLSKTGVSSVVVVIGTFCTQMHDKWGLFNFLSSLLDYIFHHHLK